MNKNQSFNNVWYGFTVCAIVMILSGILMVLSGCVSAGASPDIITTPVSAWESTMNAVAKTNWFGTFCLLSFFGGIVAIGLDQRKLGSAIVVAAIATICLGLAINRFPTWLAIIGFTGSIIGAGYSILIKNKALIEIIRGVQDYRDVKIEHDEIDNCLSRAQESKSTKKIVKKVKKCFRKKVEKGLPLVDETPDMPPVKPPRED